jgi:TM2 domain-containing membrane protein YozV
VKRTAKDTQLAYLLWIPSFFGVAGLHRFYCRRYITAVLWFFTGGLFLIGTIVDAFLMPGLVRRANSER